MRLLISMVLFAGACTKSAPADTTPIKVPVPMVEGEPASTTTPATETLAAYERVRALLAADEIKGVSEAARTLEASATSAKYTAIASSATKLAAAADLDAARVAFADVSRDVVTLLATDKALAKGQHVFECPMVQGYRKWVQPSDEMANPYMGKKMLACGGESTWQ
jgi:Cu(I)/Ag(I) efflux system membrane fusion protein